VVGFIFAGALMERGGIAQQIVDVATVFVGRIPGGLGMTTILGCMFFACMIGSGPGTAAAMGSIMIPSMIKRGYTKEYAAGVAATGGTLGLLIPPSNPMIIYGIVGNTSIATMFTAGFVPGFLLGFILMFTAYAIARRAGFKGSLEAVNIPLPTLLRRNFFSLFAPVLILGSIYSGVATPVEASILAVFYAFLVGVFITKELKLPRFIEAIQLTNISSGSIIIVLGVSTLFGRILTMQRIPHKVAELMLQITSDPWHVLLLIGLLLLIVGMFMETLSTMVILVPIFLPLVRQLGIDPIFFGIFWIVLNEIALLTPPLGVNVFIVQRIADISFERATLAVIPYVFVLLGFAFFLTLFPEIVLILPRLLGMH